MNEPKMIMMIGLPASGKSIKAIELAEEYDADIFSSDSLREEMFGDVNHQSDNDKLFVELHRRIKECLKSGKSAIYDACNISYKRRMAFLNELKNIECEKMCMLMATPYEVCLERNAERGRHVPEDVIRRMYLSFNCPYWYEGWNYINCEYADDTDGYYGKTVSWVASVMDYDQHNSHHTLSLGEHCFKTFIGVASDNSNCVLLLAALLHDVGKPDVASYMNSKHEITNELHFYSHDYVGAYKSLFFGNFNYVSPYDLLSICQLIQWHMKPMLAWKQSEKTKERDKKMLGDELFNEIMELHAADVAAH